MTESRSPKEIQKDLSAAIFKLRHGRHRIPGGCKKGMVGCRKGCLHRHMVHEYQAARRADVDKMEAETLGYEEEIKEYLAEHGPLITFKDWLLGIRRYEQEECE